MNADKIKIKNQLKQQVHTDEHRSFKSDETVSGGFIRVYLCLSVVDGRC